MGCKSHPTNTWFVCLNINGKGRMESLVLSLPHKVPCLFFLTTSSFGELSEAGGQA